MQLISFRFLNVSNSKKEALYVCRGLFTFIYTLSMYTDEETYWDSVFRAWGSCWELVGKEVFFRSTYYYIVD